MSRLIDADLLKEIAREDFLFDNLECDELNDLLNAIPTGFDVDKVIEQLIEEKITAYNEDDFSLVRAFKKAIDIVRKGGIDD